LRNLMKIMVVGTLISSPYSMLLAEDAADLHAGHEGHGTQSGHSGHAAMDEQGRRFYGMEHSLTDEQIAELKQRIEQYRHVPDQKIAESMERMGSSYEWYISDSELQGDAGVLVVAHGFRDVGDRIFRERLSKVSTSYPTALGLGMSMTMSDHLQYAVDDLQAAGAERIVVVPVVSNSHNSLMRQWNYIFGRSDEPSYATVPQVTTDADLVFAPTPENHPLFAEVLLDYALEISDEPAKEFVLVVAHGPESAEDNLITLDILSDYAAYIQKNGRFADTGIASLQDDAPAQVRQANVKAMREEVQAAQAAGYRVLVVTSLIGARVVQAELRRALRGLDYTFNAKGIAQHDNFIRWIEVSVDEALAASGD